MREQHDRAVDLDSKTTQESDESIDLPPLNLIAAVQVRRGIEREKPCVEFPNGCHEMLEILGRLQVPGVIGFDQFAWISHRAAPCHAVEAGQADVLRLCYGIESAVQFVFIIFREETERAARCRRNV